MTTTYGIDLDSFLAQYIETALWSSLDNADESGGEPLDQNYSADDLAPETLAKMRADCEAFLAHPNGGRLIERAEQLWGEGRFRGTGDGDIAGDAAHDFWLSRNGHGAGFWEEGDWPRGMGQALDKLAESFGSFDLYVGDDGLIYGA